MLNIWDGTKWSARDTPVVWNGSAWVSRDPYYFDGLDWQTEAVVAGNFSENVLLTWNVAGPSVPPPPPTQTYTATKSFAATWGASYRADGSKRTDSSDLFQGLSSSGSYNGNQKSLVGFNVSGIPSGATLVSATLSLYANHWYNNGGGVAIIGTHTNASEPSSSPGGLTPDRLRYTWNSKTGQRTINLGSTVGTALLNGSAKGLMFGPGPSSSQTYYGYFEGTGAYRPTITLKYQWVA